MKVYRLLALAAAVVLSADLALARGPACPPPGVNCCEPDKNCCDSPCTDKVCHSMKEAAKEKKHCWQVECKDICIPRITFPWEKCCGPKCGKVIKVKVLKKHEYECDTCETKWNIEEVPASCCTTPCSTGCCTSGVEIHSAPSSSPMLSPMPEVAPPLPPPPTARAAGAFRK